MYYLDRIQKAIEFIENNLEQRITVDDVAREGFLSPYHFHRLFQIMAGDSVMGYVRKRRLSAAARKLLDTGMRIIDIAVLYRFESQESFTRSFKDFFGITPGRCRKEPGKLVLYERKTLTDGNFIFYKGGIFMEPKIINKESFFVAGPKVRTTSKNGQNFIQIPKFCEKCLKDRYWEKIPNKINPDVSYGICTDFDGGEEFSYMCAYEVSDLKQIPKGMAGKVIPATKYAVFTAKGKIPDKIQEVTRYIYGEWLSKSGYERADSEDLELYDCKRMEGQEPEVDIYIPIK